MSQITHSNANTTLVINDYTLNDILTQNKLQGVTKEVIVARYGNKRIFQRDKTKVGKELEFLIKKTVVETGFGTKFTDKDWKILYIGVIDDIFRVFSSLTTNEIHIAFRLGSREEYGEFYGVSVRVFYKWLKRYMADTQQDAVMNLKKLYPPKEKEITQSDRNHIRNKWLNSVLYNYKILVDKNEYRFKDYGNILYDYLYELKLINFDKEQRKEILDEAIKVIERNAKEKKQRTIIKELSNLSIATDTNIKSAVKSEAKHIALRKFMFQCRAGKKSLRTLIQDAQTHNQKNGKN